MAPITPETVVLETDGATVQIRRPIQGVTWRYLGDRVAADSAYCARFNVQQAPEPLVAQDGAWAYVLPGSTTAH